MAHASKGFRSARYRLDGRAAWAFFICVRVTTAPTKALNNASGMIAVPPDFVGTGPKTAWDALGEGGWMAAEVLDSFCLGRGRVP